MARRATKIMNAGKPWAQMRSVHGGGLDRCYGHDDGGEAPRVCGDPSSLSRPTKRPSSLRTIARFLSWVVR